MTYRFFPLLLSLAVLTGCGKATPIRPVEDSVSEFDNNLLYKGTTTTLDGDIRGTQKYRVFHQGATGFVPLSALRTSALARVDEFCTKRHLVPHLVEERTQGIGAPGAFPSIEVIFTCIPDPNNARPPTLNKYDQLQKLKQLLDAGALTQQEYDHEKVKILAH